MLLKMEVTSWMAESSNLEIGADETSPDLVQVRNIEGLGPVKATIATADRASQRGETKTGISFPKRNIVLTLGLNPDWDTHDISTLRQLLYAYFMTGEWCKLRFFTDYLPTVEIEGYVDSFEPNIFAKDPELQVSIICPDPDFVAIDDTEITGEINLGDIVEIQYAGTSPTGILLKGQHSTETPLFDGIVGIAMGKTEPLGDSLQVEVLIDDDHRFDLSSVVGDKYVREVRLDLGGFPYTDILNKIVSSPIHWPVLQPGLNLFVFAAESGGDPGQTWTMTYYARFGGL